MPIGAFDTSAPAIGGVLFDPEIFVTQYPEFSAVPPFALRQYFAHATILLSNGSASRVTDANQREVLLCLLTAHITQLLGPTSSGLVGRVNDATEGSVNAHADWSTHVSESQAYYTQTKYGAQYWTMTARYRGFRYLPGRSVSRVRRGC